MDHSTDTTSETGWRGSRDGWLEAGYQALIEGGVDAVKIMPLAKRLNLSRTSFYWFFTDREALLLALIEGWEARSSAPLIAAAGAYAESRAEAMLNILTCFLMPGRFDARLEFAVRAWALQDATVQAKVQEADTRRLTALSLMLERWGIAAEEADIRARTIYLTQIGYISMQSEEDLQTRLSRIQTYVQIYVGHMPEPREMARFTAQFDAILARSEAY